ncbi:AbrB/MazE/SpoVT family DNA-binding domain-containing protein [Halorubrum sp. SS5]|nr:AbrB/MazE/SpoVT family DNA-binding domain-containing protein [Halorubrum sp. SS5]
MRYQKGQPMIPKELRGKHGIDPGRRVRIHETEQGEIVVEPLLSLKDFHEAATTAERGTATLGEEQKGDKQRSQRLK